MSFKHPACFKQALISSCDILLGSATSLSLISLFASRGGCDLGSVMMVVQLWCIGSPWGGFESELWGWSTHSKHLSTHSGVYIASRVLNCKVVLNVYLKCSISKWDENPDPRKICERVKSLYQCSLEKQKTQGCFKVAQVHVIRKESLKHGFEIHPNCESPWPWQRWIFMN